MKFKIGFKGYEEEKKEDLQLAKFTESRPVKSVVQVRFPSQGRSFAYYNDQFDLHVGDIVLSMESSRGCRALSQRFRVHSKSSSPTTSA